MEDSDDEQVEENEPEKEQEQTQPCTETEKEIPSSKPQKVIDLPMTEACDAWMSDGDEVGFIEDSDEEEEEVEEKEPKHEEVKPSTETQIPTSETKRVIDLPMTEACDAWMSDGNNFVLIDSEDEAEE